MRITTPRVIRAPSVRCNLRNTVCNIRHCGANAQYCTIVATHNIAPRWPRTILHPGGHAQYYTQVATHSIAPKWQRTVLHPSDHAQYCTRRSRPVLHIEATHIIAKPIRSYYFAMARNNMAPGGHAHYRTPVATHIILHPGDHITAPR